MTARAKRVRPIVAARLSALCERSEPADEPRDAHRQHEHQRDQDEPVDHRRGTAATFETSCAQMRHELDEDRPRRSGPTSEPSPATTTPTSRKIESAIGNVSGLTKVVAIANSAPATPA